MLPNYSVQDLETTTNLSFDTLIVDCIGCQWVSGILGPVGQQGKKWKLVVFPNDSGKNEAMKDMVDRGYQQILDLDLRSGAWLGFRLKAG